MRESVATSAHPASRAVDIWCFQTRPDHLRKDDWRLLSPEEQARGARLQNPRHRRSFLQGHAAIRRILAGYVGRPPDGIAFESGEYGKPSITGSAGLHCNWTHAGEAWLLAVTEGGAIGVDIEQSVRDFDWRGPAGVAFHHDEVAFIEHGAGDPLARFYDVWTYKEALLKGLGTGLHDEMQTLAVAQPIGGLACQLVLADGRPWHLSKLATRQGLTAAMATHFLPSRIVYRLSPKAAAASGEIEMTSPQQLPRALSELPTVQEASQ